MESKIEIRSAKLEENDLLGELAFRSKGYWEYSEAFMASCRAELQVAESDITNPKSSYYVAEVNGGVAGYYSLFHLRQDEYELKELFIDPANIGQGIGRKLLDHAKAHAKSLGAKTIVIQGDPNAGSFYKKMGAVLIGERESESIAGRFLPEFKIYL